MIWPPVSRPSNPESSREAEAAINESGKRKSHADVMLEVVTAWPGLVTSIVGERSGLGQMEGRKRLSDLKSKGLIRAGRLAVYEGTNRRQTTWFPVTPPGQRGQLFMDVFGEESDR